MRLCRDLVGPTGGEVAVTGGGEMQPVRCGNGGSSQGVGLQDAPGKEILCKPGKVARVEDTDHCRVHSSLPSSTGSTLPSRGVRV